MNQEPVSTFKLPKNYNKDNLDITTYLNKIIARQRVFLTGY